MVKAFFGFKELSHHVFAVEADDLTPSLATALASVPPFIFAFWPQFGSVQKAAHRGMAVLGPKRSFAKTSRSACVDSGSGDSRWWDDPNLE
jgi:hypothetical protein